MITAKQQIQDKLNASAQIVRQYNLGDKNYFISKFPNTNKTQLETAWTFGQRKIQNREIIKDASSISADETNLANERTINVEKNIEGLFNYLNSEFNVKKLKLTDENVERRFRHNLAELYIGNILNEVSELSIKDNSSIKSKTFAFFGKFKAAFIILGIVGVFATPTIIDGLTPVDILTEKIHEKSKYKFNGSICNDGTTSHSQGRGTCSWHGGVNYKFYKGDYKKTIEECREEAINRSWRD